MFRLAEMLQLGGLRIIVIAPLDQEMEKQLLAKHIQCYSLNLIPLRGGRKIRSNLKFLVMLLPYILRVTRIIRLNRADIVHVNEITDIVGMLSGFFSGVPSVLHIRAHYDSRLMSRGLLLFARIFVDRIIVPSQSVRTWVRAHMPSLDSRMTLIQDVGLDPDRFRIDTDGACIRQELGVPANTPMILLVSKLSPLKGHLVFLEAASLVARSHAAAVFVIVGDAMTDHIEEAQYIRDQADLLRGQCQIRLLGFRGDTPEIFAAADIFVHCPIYDDPFPTVVIEAMMMGKPVIGSAIGGIVEQIEPGVTGLLVPPNDSVALAAAISRLIEDPKLRIRLGSAARCYAHERYDSTAQAKRQIFEYDKIIEEMG